MVSASMLPGSGMTELSPSPNKIRPGPPRRRSHRTVCEAATRVRRRKSIRHLKKSWLLTDRVWVSEDQVPRVVRSLDSERPEIAKQAQRAEHRTRPRIDRRAVILPDTPDRDKSGYSSSDNY